MHCGSKARCVVSTFSAMHRYATSYPCSHCYLTVLSLPPSFFSDLAQVLNITSSQLCIVSSSMDASMESATFAERLDGSFLSLIQPYRYTSYEISTPLRPTTMLFGCPLPDELDGASIGQRAVAEAFETILSSAAVTHPESLYEAMCDAHKHQGNDIKLVNHLVMCRSQCPLMSLLIVSAPTGIIMGSVSEIWWSRSCWLSSQRC